MKTVSCMGLSGLGGFSDAPIDMVSEGVAWSECSDANQAAMCYCGCGYLVPV